MKAEIKEKWIVALRSGEYEQGTGYLHHKNKFCCLGVLCDLYLKEHNESWQESENSEFNGVVGKSINGNNASLPKKISEWSGINSHGRFRSPDQTQTISLAGLNDRGSSFSEIATIIEKNF